jgi:hypothetical protein
VYWGIGGHVVPGFGGQVMLGVTVANSSKVDWGVEFGYAYDDLTAWFDDEGAGGKLHLYTAGVRARTNPCGRSHWTFRGGFAVFNVTGRPQDIDFDFVDLPGPGVYIGGYAAIGYEWDLGGDWSTGPEARIVAGFRSGSDADEEFGWTPMFSWGIYGRL